MIKNEVLKWAKRGSQKRAVLQALNGPMTPVAILRRAQRINPKISFGDVSHLLHEMERRGLIKCLTPTLLTGKIYCPTRIGRELLWREFSIKAQRLRHDIDWSKCAMVLAGRTRRRLLLEMRYGQALHEEGSSVSALRRRLNRTCPITLNQAYCTMQALLAEGLAEIRGHTRKRDSKLYRLTLAGDAIAEMLSQNSQEFQVNPY